MNDKLCNLNLKLSSLVIFRKLLTQPIIIRLQYLLRKSQENSEEELINAYSDFVSILYKKGDNLSVAIYQLVMEEDNVYIERKAMNENINDLYESALKNELGIWEEISQLTSDLFIKRIKENTIPLARWNTTPYSFIEEYQKRVLDVKKNGYGMYAQYHVFSLVDGNIVPTHYPDTQKLSDFTDYERERTLLIKNTKILLQGMKASNALLYGDAGTGKSSTIKAIVNEYHKEGLRLIEIKKHQLFQIPQVIDLLSKNPLKFIIFIDDLSFVANDENFAALKSILEGGVSTFHNNVVIYATSNRRHFLKEEHHTRLGDDVHLSDTLQETMSLASRFGLTITFNQPDKEVYLRIVKDLAQKEKLSLTQEELFRKAEAYAIMHHGRSPRTARQFIALEKAGIKIV